MYLADNEIKQLIEKQSVLDPYDKEKVGAANYDLSIDSIIIPNPKEDSEKDNYELEPGESVFVSTIEKLKMPNDYVGMIIPRNSLIRMGLSIEAPVYQPGHETKIFIRVTNVSSGSITLKKDDGIASIMFEKLSSPASKPYSGTFKEEFSFKGIGDFHKVKIPKLSYLKKK